MVCGPLYLWIQLTCVWLHILDGGWPITLLAGKLVRPHLAEPAPKLISKRAALCSWLRRMMRSKGSAAKRSCCCILTFQ